eukprot:UC1_evm1s359
MEVLSVLLPLVQDRRLFVPALGTVYEAAPGFKLFATQRLEQQIGMGGAAASSSPHTRLLDGLWTRIHLQPPNRRELEQLVAGRYPKLSHVAAPLVGVYAQLNHVPNTVASHNSMDSTKKSSAAAANHASDVADSSEVSALATSATGANLSPTFNQKLPPWGKLARPLTARDLFKWCQRLSVTDMAESRVFQEAIDCFCGSIDSANKRDAVARTVASALDVPEHDLLHLQYAYTPELNVTEDAVAIGRAQVQRAARGSVRLHAGTARFALSRHSLTLLERVAVAVQQDENVLLVGETGTGKTTAVQHLADLMRCRLVVVNMSQQSDSADLLGGFKPIDIRMVAEPALRLFESAFCQTFSRKANQKYLEGVRARYMAGHWRTL